MADDNQPSAPDTASLSAENQHAPLIWTGQRRRAWWLALALATGVAGGLGWLLARLVWLPFFFGLFFYLVTGLLAGAAVFRIARLARPITRGRVLRGVLLVATLGTAITIGFESRHIAATAGGPPRFADARNAALAERRSTKPIQALAREAFQAMLREVYAPGGVIGYVRWAVASGERELTILGCTDTVSIGHRGGVWVFRTLLGFALLAIGLWSSLESLRTVGPVSNILMPGEEFEEAS